MSKIKPNQNNKSKKLTKKQIREMQIKQSNTIAFIFIVIFLILFFSMVNSAMNGNRSYNDDSFAIVFFVVVAVAFISGAIARR